MNRTPCVFISSVFKTLRKVRNNIYKIITKDFGWKVWWAEDYQEETRGASPGQVRQVCFNGIESSDLYIGIFPSRYGDDRLGLAFTELEYHHAIKVGIPTLCYHLQDHAVVEPTQRLKQKAFLLLLKDADLGEPNLKVVKSKQELYERIKRDLHEFEKNWSMDETRKYDPYQSPQHLLLPFKFVPDLRPLRLSLHGEKDFNPAMVRFYFRVMDQVYEESFHKAIEVASVLLDYMLSLPNFEDQEYMDILIQLLGRWHKTGSWAGITGTLSPLNAAKAQMKARQLAGDYENLYKTATAIANCYYSEGKIETVAKRLIPRLFYC